MADLIYLMNSLVDTDGKILISEIMDDVLPVTDQERKTYENIEFDVDEYRKTMGCQKLRHKENKVSYMNK